MNTLGKFIALAFSVTLVACSRSPAPASPVVSMEIVPGTGVGPVQLGMTMDEVKKSLGNPDSTPGKALQYSARGLAILPSSADGTVGAIMIGDTSGGPLVDKFTGATKEGIKMRSTRDEIVAAYGQPESAKTTPDGLEELRYGKTQYQLREGRLVHITVRR
jgi:hypothetical protein